MAADDNKSILSWRYFPYVLTAALLAFALVMFRGVLIPGRILFTTDDGIGALAIRAHALPYGFLGWWDDTVLMGMPQILNINWTNLWLRLLPLNFFMNWIHAIDLLAASIFMALYLRHRRCSWPAIGLAILTAFWIGSNFTLTYAGHIGKFGLLIFAPAYLWLSDLAVQRKSAACAVLAGGALGAMFVEQADVALFCALFLVPYTLATLLGAHGRNMALLFRLMTPLAVVAALVSFHALWSGYQGSVKGVATQSKEDPRAKWEFSTQWSWPPEDSIDFVAPGYMGWRSNEPKGPYWGRMGRSAGWQDTKQGFMNFKLENHYLGLVPVALALWACSLIWSSAMERDRRRQLIIWMSITVLTLLLAFGKNFFLYSLLYALPGFSSIRNPNKFLHLFQIGLAVLAAYGLDEALRAPQATKRLRQVLFVAAAALFLWCLGSFSNASSAVSRMSSEGWGAVAQTIVENKAFALGHAAIMAVALAIILHLMVKRQALTGLPWALVLVVALDALYLARNYISTMSADAVKENDVTQLLKDEGVNHRVALASQDGFYNYWLTYVFPYHGIQVLNFTQMPRMPADYQAFLDVVGRNPVRLWQAAAVKEVIGPAQVWGQMQNDPQLKDKFKLRYAFNVAASSEGTFTVVPATPEQPGQHCVIEFNSAVPRYALAGRWRPATDESALQKMRENEPGMLDEILVSSDVRIEASAPDAAAGPAGDVTVREYHPGRVTLGTSVNRPAILRIADRYTPDWKAWVDGQPAEILRCDYLAQGLLLDPGLHEVVLRYAPAIWSVWIQMAGFAACVAAAASLMLQKRIRA